MEMVMNVALGMVGIYEGHLKVLHLWWLYWIVIFLAHLTIGWTPVVIMPRTETKML